MKPEDFIKIRKKIGSQFKVALLLDVSQGQVSVWEMGYRPIPEGIEEKMKSLLSEVK